MGNIQQWFGFINTWLLFQAIIRCISSMTNVLHTCIALCCGSRWGLGLKCMSEYHLISWHDMVEFPSWITCSCLEWIMVVDCCMCTFHMHLGWGVASVGDTLLSVAHPIRENISGGGYTPLDGAYSGPQWRRKADLWLLIHFCKTFAKLVFGHVMYVKEL